MEDIVLGRDLKKSKYEKTKLVSHKTCWERWMRLITSKGKMGRKNEDR